MKTTITLMLAILMFASCKNTSEETVCELNNSVTVSEEYTKKFQMKPLYFYMQYNDRLIEEKPDEGRSNVLLFDAEHKDESGIVQEQIEISSYNFTGGNRTKSEKNVLGMMKDFQKDSGMTITKEEVVTQNINGQDYEVLNLWQTYDGTNEKFSGDYVMQLICVYVPKSLKPGGLMVKLKAKVAVDGIQNPSDITTSSCLGDAFKSIELL